MMRVLEFEAKQLLREQGLPVPNGELAASSQEAARAAQSLGGAVVIKAQLPMGGRMKAGGIRFASSPVEAETEAAALFGQRIRGFSIDRVLVEDQIEIDREVFIGVLYEAGSRSAMLVASASGGIEVESAKTVIRRPFSCVIPPSEYIGRQMASDLGFSGQSFLRLGSLITQLMQCFLRWDATLLEINPLAVDKDNRWWIADVHLELDDDAAFRQHDLLEKLTSSSDQAVLKSEFELRAKQINQKDHRGVAGRLVPFDGNLGLLIGGGGASLTTFDAVLDAGLKPANYCEIGGNPSVWKIQELTKLILGQPQVDRLAVIMNVVSNTRVDLVARGVIKGILQMGKEPSKVIAGFRVPGSWEDEGKVILNYYGVPYFGRETSIDQVVEAIKCQS
jgi:succinyl-CoA synthetase beta subunit/citryl-CoA synthetase large subunit